MKTYHHTRYPLAIMVLGSLLLLGIAGIAAAVEVENQTQDKAKFEKLLSERKKLNNQLYQLDRRAAEKIKNGEDPVVIHAEQIGLQDQLDLVELRAEILAIRLGAAVPDLGGQSNAYGSDTVSNKEDPVESRARDVLQRGRSRAMNRLRRDCLQLLASIDFSRFLDESKRK